MTGVDLGSIRKVEPKGFSNGFDVSGKKTSRKRTRFWSEARCHELSLAGRWSAVGSVLTLRNPSNAGRCLPGAQGSGRGGNSLCVYRWLLQPWVGLGGIT